MQFVVRTVAPEENCTPPRPRIGLGFGDRVKFRGGDNFSQGQFSQNHGNYIITKYMIASARVTNTKIFTFIATLGSKFLSREVLFINRKDNRYC